MPTPVADRVARGAAELDILHPGWFKKINVDVLSLGSCTLCILGQLYGKFPDALCQFKAARALEYLDRLAWSEKHGFSFYTDPDRDHNKLTLLWIAHIHERMTAA